MLDWHELQAQIPDFSDYQGEEQARRAAQLRRALDALDACDPCWEALREQVAQIQPKWLVAGLREAPKGAHTAAARPTPITVVATDGSQIYPDRHVEPTCYLLNISRIAFHYGTHEQPLMEAVPAFRYRGDEFADLFADALETATTEVVSAIRDQYELEQLFETAEAVQQPGRPLVAMADGTLIRWMLRSLRNPRLEGPLIAKYTEVLARFRAAQIPLCSYISMPGNTEVVNLLRIHQGDRPDLPLPAEESLEGLADRKVFEQTLPPGARSALFESASHIQREYGENRICYFYLHVPAEAGPGEIGRVEVPLWVAEDPALIDRIHAVVLSECEKGRGYPMILSEAHERAVIRSHERERFYDLLERGLHHAGLPFLGSRKQASKRKPMV